MVGEILTARVDETTFAATRVQVPVCTSAVCSTTADRPRTAGARAILQQQYLLIPGYYTSIRRAAAACWSSRGWTAAADAAGGPRARGAVLLMLDRRVYSYSYRYEYRYQYSYLYG